MATTVDDVARETLNSVASNAGILQTIRWISQRYRQLAQRGKMRHLRRVAEVVIPASLSTGTITAVRESQVITGDTDAQTAWAAAAGADGLGLVGRYFRFRRNWYEIAGVELSGSAPQLRLTSPVAEEDSDDVTYKIVQKHTKMPADLQQLGAFVHMRLWRPLTKMSIMELDLTQPERIFVAGTGPEMWAEVGNDAQGIRTIEFYPYPVENELIRFFYYAKSPDLEPGDFVPNEIAVEVLKSGALIDVMRFEMAQALRQNNVEAAALWRNELRAQETTWGKRMEEAMQAERATDDISVILHTNGPPVYGDMTFIRTARQDAISRLGNFP